MIAIIAILMAILMPALSNAREQAKRIMCVSNLKQIGTGVSVYLSDGDDIPKMRTWDYHHVTEQQGGQPVMNDHRDFLLLLTNNNKQVYYCPSHNGFDGPGNPRCWDKPGDLGVAGTERVISYGLIGLWWPIPWHDIGGGGGWDAGWVTYFTELNYKTPTNRPVKVTQMTNPSKVAIATDSQASYTATATYAWPGYLWAANEKNEVYPHRKNGIWTGSSTLFFDGHALFRTRQDMGVTTHPRNNAKWFHWYNRGEGNGEKPVFW